MELDRAASVPQAGQPTLRPAATANTIEFLSNCRSRFRHLVAGFLFYWWWLLAEASFFWKRVSRYYNRKRSLIARNQLMAGGSRGVRGWYVVVYRFEYQRGFVRFVSTSRLTHRVLCFPPPSQTLIAEDIRRELVNGD